MWFIKEFEQLEASELEQILRLRQSIFILEQESLFEDIDGHDAEAIHIFNKHDDEIWAYSRILVHDDHIILGRVTVDKDKRGSGSGSKLLDYVMDYAKTTYPNKDIHIVAMSYLKKFYQSKGFETTSDVFYIDDHPHEDMIYRQ